MWISKKKYQELIDENQRLMDLKNNYLYSLDCSEENNKILSEKNKKLEQQIEQLKVKYADEVNKNFELANYLSKIKNGTLCL